MRALGSCSTIFTTSHSGYRSEINSNHRRAYSSHRAQFVHLNWVSAGGPLVPLPPTHVRCSTICPTEDGHAETNADENSNVVSEREESGRCDSDDEDVGTSGFDEHFASIDGEVGSETSPLSDAWRKLVDGAEMRLHFLEETDEELLSRRIVSLSRSNKTRSALEMYLSMEMAGLQLTPHACNSLISCTLRNGSVDDALRVFEDARRKGVLTGHTCSLLLKAVAAERGGDCALSMFLDLEEEGLCKGKFDVIVYNTVLTICGKARNWREAERLWSKLKEQGLRGTRVTYCLLISTFVQCGQTDLALSTYSEMVQNGFEADEDDMKAIIATCTSEGRWDVAVNVLWKMLAKGNKPDIALFNAVINCLGKAGEVNRAFEIFELIKSSDRVPDTYTWNALLNALYRSRRYTDCLHLFTVISKRHSSDVNFHLFNTALMSCQKLGLWKRSLQILWLMESSGLQVTTATYNLVIGACEKARKPQATLEVYKHMVHKNCHPDTFTFLTLIRACVWGSLWTEVENILEHAEPNASLYNALIQGFFLRGKIRLATELYAKMRDSGLEADGKTKALMLQYMPKESMRHARLANQK